MKTETTLEEMVRIDMVKLGYDPNNPQDVEDYWNEYLKEPTLH